METGHPLLGGNFREGGGGRKGMGKRKRIMVLNFRDPAEDFGAGFFLPRERACKKKFARLRCIGKTGKTRLQKPEGGAAKSIQQR